MRALLDQHRHTHDVSDEQHIMGMGDAFVALLKERITKLQSVIAKAKAHSRRIASQGAGKDDIQSELQKVCDDEDQIANEAEAAKKIYSIAIKDQPSQLIVAFQACDAQATKFSFSLLARVWRAEIEVDLMHEKYEQFCRHFDADSARAIAIKELAVKFSRPNFHVDSAIYVLEDSPTTNNINILCIDHISLLSLS